MQLVAGASMATIGGASLQDLGDLAGFGVINLGLLAIPFTAVAITGL